MYSPSYVSTVASGFSVPVGCCSFRSTNVYSTINSESAYHHGTVARTHIRVVETILALALI